ncbi:MAG: C4-dicarboxylate ABC transporter permease, partial [Firmicutes bacterium]|nr:C4-dicarboxylate ABC transporter permease [Bacillota bacterium]
ATMPIMVPLADVLGLTRQTAVMCFQFGDGFTNSIIPTSSTLMANLGTANITYDKYVKFILPLMGIWFALGIVFVVIATMIGYGPF